MKVINGLYPGVTTVELDTLAAETAAMMTTDHPDYAILAARIAVSNLHKETKKQFSGKILLVWLLLINQLCNPKLFLKHASPSIPLVVLNFLSFMLHSLSFTM